MQAVILAGGQGMRLHHISASSAKPMMPLFDQPVLEHSIRLLAWHGIKDIIIATSHELTDLIEYFGDGSRWGVKIRYSIEHEARGTAGAVKLAKGMISGTFMVFSGDVVTDVDLTEAMKRHWGAAALASIVLHRVDDPSQYGLVRHDLRGKITHFAEKPKSSEIIGSTVSTGIYILEPEALSSIPYDDYCDFARQVFPRMLNNNEPVYGFNVRGYWCDIGDTISYRNAHADALTGALNLKLPVKQIREGVWVGEGATIDHSARISSPVYIGAGAQIKRNATLGKRTIIGEDAVIGEGAEIFQCVVGAKSRIGENTVVKNSIVIGGHSIPEDEYINNELRIWKPVYSIKEEAAPKIERKTVVKQPGIGIRV